MILDMTYQGFFISTGTLAFIGCLMYYQHIRIMLKKVARKIERAEAEFAKEECSS